MATVPEFSETFKPQNREARLGAEKMAEERDEIVDRTGNLGEQLSALRSDLGTLGTALRDYISGQSKHLAREAGNTASTLADQGREYAAHARDRASQTAGEVRHTIEANPLTATAIAVGVGFILGALLRGSSDR